MLERVRDPEQRVDPRRAPTAFEARDRRLRRPRQLGELALGETALGPPRGDVVRDLREQVAALGLDRLLGALAQPVNRRLSLQA